MEFGKKQTLGSDKAYQVWKHNDVVQKSKISLSVTELKMVNFLVSLIKPKNSYFNMIQPIEYEFKIQDYCKMCNLDHSQGKNYKMIKDTLAVLCRKDFILTLPDGTEKRVRWLNKFWPNKGSGDVKIRFDDDMAPYLFDLDIKTTRFDFHNISSMKSKYSIRLYEICKSWAKAHRKEYTIEDLKAMLGIAENELERYSDFKKRVLDKAQEEINGFTDLNISFEAIKKSKKPVAFIIHIGVKKVSYNKYLEDYLAIPEYSTEESDNMNNNMYCPECKCEREVEIRNEKEVYPVKGEDTEIDAKVTYCKFCGEQIWNDEVNNDNLIRALNKYRKNHGLPELYGGFS